MDKEYLKKCRLEKGYTQKQVANELGITLGAVNQWEVTDKNPKVSILIKLCKLLDMDANILLNLKENV